MGAWGPGLYQNDVAQDIKDEYINLLKMSLSNEEATKQIISDNSDLLQDEDDAPDFWFSLADTQWKWGRLLPEIKEKALSYAACANYDRWNTLGKVFVKKRVQVVSALVARLESPQPPVRKITPYKYYKCPWQLGDTFAYRLESEYAKSTDFYGHYLIIHKVGEYPVKKGNDFDLFPIVYTKITLSPRLPMTSDEMNRECEFVRYGFHRKTGLFKYISVNHTDSSRLLKKLIYIGNFTMNKPLDELVESDIGYPLDIMYSKHYEKSKIDRYLHLKDG